MNQSAAGAAAADAVHFTEVDVRRHIRRRHPDCPETVQRALIARIVARSWPGCKIGEAFGIAAANYVRHELTDYERLMKVDGLWREEARLVVKGEVEDIISSWSGRKERTPVDPAAKLLARTRARSRRRKRAKARRRARKAIPAATTGLPSA